MNIRRIISAFLTGMIISQAMPLTVYADDNTETKSAGTPVLKIRSAEIYEKDVRKGRPCRVTLTVDGADKRYCSTQIYVYYDRKLKIENDAEAGAAIAELEAIPMKGDTGDFIFLTTAGSEDSGLDGDMWHIDFTLPKTAVSGDEFEVYLGDSKYGKILSLFTNFADDENGSKMTAQAFKNKVAAKIKVIDDPPYTLGDFTDDGIINGVDASGILTFYAKSSVDPLLKLGRYEFGCADVNEDGVVNAVDASTVLKYYAYVSANGKMSFDEYLK